MTIKLIPDSRDIPCFQVIGLDMYPVEPPYLFLLLSLLYLSYFLSHPPWFLKQLNSLPFLLE